MQQTLIDYINEELLVDEDGTQVDADSELLLEGYLDSLGVMRLVAFVDERFGLRVPPQDVTIENFSSVAVLAGHLQTLQARSGAA